MQPTLILLRGNSSSGKTTVAWALQRRLGRSMLLLSQDAIRREMLYASDGPDTPAIPLLSHLLEYGATHCPAVILEGILTAQWYAPVFRAAQQRFSDPSPPGISTCPLRRRCAATRPSPTARILARRTCAAGGARRTTSAFCPSIR